MPSKPGPQIQSTVLTPLHCYNETDSYESNELKDLQTEMGVLKYFCVGVVFRNETKYKVEL